MPYFAYHKVEDQVIVGFYFSSILGHASAAFEVVDPQTKEFFGQHFNSIMARANATYVLRTNPHNGRPEMNSALLNQLEDMLTKELDSEIFVSRGHLQS